MEDLGDDPYGLETLNVENYDPNAYRRMSFGKPVVQVSYQDCTRVSVAPTPFDGALAAVGICKAGLRYPVGQFVPHARNFSVFSTGYYSFKEQLVRSFRLPPMSAELISHGVLTSMSFESGTGVLNYGQSQTTYTCGGVRGKLDGYEVIQFVVKTDSYVQAFLYDIDRIIPLDDVFEPARYERKDGKYYLLGGQPSPSLSPISHPWFYPTKEGIEHARTPEGVVLNINGLEYKVKDCRSATLLFSKNRILDYNGKAYAVREIVVPLVDNCCFEAEFELPQDELKKTAKFLVVRPDKKDPDTTNSIDRIVKAPNVANLMARAPFGYTDPVVTNPSYSVTDTKNYDAYRSETYNLSGVGPSIWSTIPILEKKSDDLPVTSEGLIRTMISNGAREINYASIQEECNRLGISLLGQSIRDLTYRPHPCTMIIDKYHYSTTAPPTGQFVFELHVYGENSAFDENFSNSFISIRDLKVLILFRTLLLDHIVVPAIPPPLLTAPMIYSFLRSTPSPTNVICREFGQTRGVVLTLLEGHPELFRKDERCKPPVWRVRVI